MKILFLYRFYTISSILSYNYLNNNHILSPPYVEPSQIKEDFKIREAGTIYDIKFNPFFNSLYPQTCYFICTSKDHPIHLYNAYNGELLCSYCGYNHLDELTNAYSLCIVNDKIYSGYKNMILTFDINIPGKNFQQFNTCKSKKSKEGQKGILSTIDFNSEISNMFAVGSYNGSVYLYDIRNNEVINNIDNIEKNGVTEVKFNHKGDMLYIGGRNNDNCIYEYDIRMLNNNNPLSKYERKVNTNQLFRFVLSNDDKYLFSGNSDNKIRIYNTTKATTTTTTTCTLSNNNNEMINEINGFSDAVNSIDLHPYLPILLAGTGQRHFNIPTLEEERIDSDSDSDNDNDDDEEMKEDCNNIKIMYVGVM